MSNLNRKLRAVSAAEEESKRRNEDFLRALTKVAKHADALNVKTEKLKRIRVRLILKITLMFKNKESSPNFDTNSLSGFIIYSKFSRSMIPKFVPKQ